MIGKISHDDFTAIHYSHRPWEGTGTCWIHRWIQRPVRYVNDTGH